jgi:hypothetical protein
LTVSVVVPVLHVPDEPTALAADWLAAVVDGRDLDSVLTDGGDGVIAWLWQRWRSLAVTGLSEAAFAEIVLGYRREVWLWLAGERTWAQCCSGLIGRINRRVGDGADSIEA